MEGFEMKRFPIVVLSFAALFACASSTVDQPYESCTASEGCTQGTGCIESTLPASAGYTGNFCSTGCNNSNDCLQDLSNYAAICVNGACYIQCPAGGQTCPYGTGCLDFTDQNNDIVSLCTP
jgi:hypothetical protein